MRIVVFGAGDIYINNKEQIRPEDKVIAFLDNDKKKVGNKLDGINIYLPSSIVDLEYDVVLLMSTYSAQMKEQLLNIGINEKKIWYFDQYKCTGADSLSELPKEYKRRKSDNSYVLIITTELDYNGGTVAAMYMANAIMQLGRRVLVVAPDGKKRFIDEMESDGISIFLYRKLPYVDKGDMKWICDFDTVVVNTLQMVRVAVVAKELNHVVWWLHEPNSNYIGIYSAVMDEYNEYTKETMLAGIDVYAVSDMVRKSFCKLFPKMKTGILPFGIPDNSFFFKENQKSRIVFATIGTIYKVKGQDILADAIVQLPKEDLNKSEFWFVGADYGGPVSDIVHRKLEGIDHVRFLGKVSQKRMKELYRRIDVIVCPSRVESLSIVVTEGLMNSKICVVSDNTGIKEYIDNYESGLIFKSEDSIELSNKLDWIIKNKNESNRICKKSRKVYDKWFSMSVFVEKICKVLFVETDDNE